MAVARSSSCEANTTVREAARDPARSSSRRSRPSWSRPACGSSSNHNRAPRATSRAREARRRWPAEHRASGIDARRPVKPNCSSAGRIPTTGPLEARTANSRFSSTVSSSYRNDSWPSMPTCPRTARRSATRSQPSTVASPECTGNNPARTLSRLVLPAPFGPRRCTTSPSPTSRQAPARRGNRPASATASWRRTAGGMKIAHVTGQAACRSRGRPTAKRPPPHDRSQRPRPPRSTTNLRAAPELRKPGGALVRDRSRPSSLLALRSRRASSNRASREPWPRCPRGCPPPRAE